MPVGYVPVEQSNRLQLHYIGEIRRTWITFYKHTTRSSARVLVADDALCWRAGAIVQIGEWVALTH
jgi:hypothetical protein